VRKAKGVVGVFSGPDGRTICSVSDFECDMAAGISRQEAQTYRVNRKLARAIVQAFCSDVIADVIDQYRCDEIMGKLMSRSGYVKSIIPVGYEDEPDA
jgi:hypothetical protein